MQEVTDWFAAKVPGGWFTERPTVHVDREEIVVIGRLTAGVDPVQFREETRDARVGIAAEAERRFGRKV